VRTAILLAHCQGSGPQQRVPDNWADINGLNRNALDGGEYVTLASMVDRTNDAKPILVLITGLQGTGKSTAADQAAEFLGASVLAHDWAMSGLRPFGAVQRALDSMTPPGHQPVGWSILCALARAQIRRGSSVVLDGVAREAAIELCRQVAGEEGARFLLVLTECADLEFHQLRIEARERSIPDWYELDWDHVQHSSTQWERPERVDLALQATDSTEDNRERLAALLKP
jgi:predicted kinase